MAEKLKSSPGAHNEAVDTERTYGNLACGISTLVAASALAAVTAQSANAETMEEYLGNPNNYHAVGFVDNSTDQIVFCRIHNNTLRWWSDDRANPGPAGRRVLERNFQPTYPAGIESIGDEATVHEADANYIWGPSFNTQLGNTFENSGPFSEPKNVLLRNTDSIIESPLRGMSGAYDFSAVAPLWNGNIGIVIDGATRGGTLDGGDIREIPENISGNLPITTREDLIARSIRRDDIDPDPTNPNQVNNTTSFAVTENFAFASSAVNQGLSTVVPLHIDVFDRDENNRAENKRFLSSNPALVQCAYEDPNAVVLFVNHGVYELYAGVFLKDDLETLVGRQADGIENIRDICPEHPNYGQENSDLDGLGDVCDPCPNDSLQAGETDDPDNDTVCNRDGNEAMGTTGFDDCPNITNPNQANADGDNLGDACDTCPLDNKNDIDHDGICGNVDNCSTISNPNQEDSDNDNIGDACDDFPLDPNNDIDGDLIGGNEDNCPNNSNFDQADFDRDDIGDVCDPYPNCPENIASICAPTQGGDGGRDSGENHVDAGTGEDAGAIDGGSVNPNDAGSAGEEDAGERDGGQQEDGGDGGRDANVPTDGPVHPVDAGEEDAGKDGGSNHTDARNSDNGDGEITENGGGGCGCGTTNENADPVALALLSIGALATRIRKKEERASA